MLRSGHRELALTPDPLPSDRMGKGRLRFQEGHASPILSAAMNASCEMLALPHSRIGVLPFCL